MAGLGRRGRGVAVGVAVGEDSAAGLVRQGEGGTELAWVMGDGGGPAWAGGGMTGATRAGGGGSAGGGAAPAGQGGPGAGAEAKVSWRWRWRSRMQRSVQYLRQTSWKVAALLSVMVTMKSRVDGRTAARSESERTGQWNC